MNVITVTFNSASKIAKTNALWQYDYGQVLKFEGIELPEHYEVHFATNPRGYALTVLGDENGVQIPDEYLQQCVVIYAWLFLHNEDDDGETKYQVMIPVNARAMPTDAQPTPMEQSAISQAMALLNAFRNELAGCPPYSELVARVQSLEVSIQEMQIHSD